MKKKEQNSFHIFIMALFFSAIILFIIVGAFYVKDKKTFNLDEDVCEEFECFVEFEKGHNYFWESNSECDFSGFEDKKPYESANFDEECKSYRKKNICEKDPNNIEDCECDEYISFKEYMESNPEIGEITLQEARDLGLCEYGRKEATTQAEATFWINCSDRCLKAHPKNHCEKADKNYIEECNLYRLFAKYNTSFNGKESYLYGKEAFETQDNWREFATHYECEDKICRKKTLYDFNCTSLNKILFFRWKYVYICNSKLTNNPPICLSCCYGDGIKLEQVYNTAKEKGCI